MDRCEEAIRYLEDVLATLPLNSEFRTMIHFSLGTLYDRDGKFGPAFEQFEQGNNAKQQFYDPDQHTATIDQIIRTFPATAFRDLPVSDNTSELPVFIVGMPRSGTSLAERVLSSHTAVAAGGELRNIYDLTEEIAGMAGENMRFPTGVDQLTRADLQRLSGEYLDVITRIGEGALRVTDKLPHNFQHIGLIRMLFPNARIIHCIRDARDTCLSCYFQNFFGYHPYTENLEHLGRHYRDYRRLMDHWKTAGIPMLELPYEQMVDDPETWTHKLIEYCGLDWEDQCLRFHESDQHTRTASYDQVRQPIYKGSVGRWKNYETQLSPLLRELGE